MAWEPPRPCPRRAARRRQARAALRAPRRALLAPLGLFALGGGRCWAPGGLDPAAAAAPAGGPAARRPPLRREAATAAALCGCQVVGGWAAPALAERSRTAGYEVQREEKEWQRELSRLEYRVLRQGGTESPWTSTLLQEKRPGTFKCVACGNDLFSSSEKFDSGTGWPSFASGLPGVEIEEVNPLLMTLAGAELRCGRCGGHLGDVFGDGLLFPGSRAFLTGRRFCIDGAALLFQPTGGGPAVRGEGAEPPPPQLPEWLQPPKRPGRQAAT